MVAVVAALALAAVLLLSAGLKLADPAGTRSALATYGIVRPRLAHAAWALLVGLELALGAGAAAGIRGALWGGAALFAVFSSPRPPSSAAAAPERRVRASARAGPWESRR
jgi:hypothetical protein